MASPPKSKPVPKWVIDLHGIKEALTTRSNARARIIDAIECGEMLVLRSVQDELKAAYEHLWDDFVAIKPRKYTDANMAVSAIAAQLQATHGSSPLGGIPDFAHFEAVALARSLKCKLVSAGKGHADCCDIAKKGGLPSATVQTISDV